MKQSEFNQHLAKELQLNGVSATVKDNSVLIQNNKGNALKVSTRHNVVTIETTTEQPDNVVDWKRAYMPNMIALTRDKVIEYVKEWQA